MQWSENAQLAWDTIQGKPTRGIPTWLWQTMEHRMIDRVAGRPEGAYRRDPVPTYLAMLVNSGVGMVDQWIPTNPLSIGDQGYEGGAPRTATTGAAEIVRNGIRIDSPEAVVEDIERHGLPWLRKSIAEFDEDQWVAERLRAEREVQALFGSAIVKHPYNAAFPGLQYYWYGYENYFMAYALYPEVLGRDFALQAEFAALRNRALLRVYREGGFAPLCRLDHDMADSRGTLVDIQSLDALWFPHFARALEPLLNSEVKLIWHCDGNLSQMVPRLLEVGLKGFQGFQYEDGMDYEAICKLKTRDGEPLFIIAGVSVTRTLPHGTPEDVRREMTWLVRHGPKTGLVLGCSSSVAPGVPWENLQALIEGFRYYRAQGRQ